MRDDGLTLFFSTLNLRLDSHVSGEANAHAGVTAGALNSTARAASSLAYGSTGTLTGTIDSTGVLTGTFKGVQGNDRTTPSCRGA